jgi:phenylalanyl-tRNA synthetase beta chain
VLGERFDGPRIVEYLSPLGFDATVGADESVTVRVPGHRRHDVAREEDLIEEIARRHGYDAFSDELRAFRPGVVPEHPLFQVEDRVRRMLVQRGFMEAHTAAFVPEQDGDVPLLLPLAATESRLRRALLPGLVRRVEYNFARGARSIRLFELGTVFAVADEGDLPPEATHVALAFTGLRRPPHWTEPEAAFDVWDLKAVAAELASAFDLRLEEHAEHPLLDAGLSFRLLDAHNGGVRGVAGRAGNGVVDAPAWAHDCWLLELTLGSDAVAPAIRFRALPSHPAVERDLALLVPVATAAGAVTAAIAESAGPLLEHAEAFDVYAGAGVQAGERSIAYRLRFRAADRTLTDAEVDAVIRQVLKRVNDDLGVRQRA